MSRGEYTLACLVLCCSCLTASGQQSASPTYLNAMGDHTCVILEDQRTKCWGNNARGHLGLEDTNNRGDQPGEMGDALPAVDLGTGRRAISMSAGAFHRCAILDNGQLKCWGKGEKGQLGYEDRLDRGATPGEMGDNLPAIALGTGLTAVLVTSGDYHTCAVVNGGRMKCWGGGGEGQLGKGDDNDWGTQPGEMGDNLPYVELGDGRTVVGAASGDFHTCVLLDNGGVKCFGDGFEGQLGYGDNRRRGDKPDQMGENLPEVDLGTGRTAKQVSAGWFHTCALLDDNSVKCWGFGGHGQLGQGDRIWYGQRPNQMGDNLPPINLGTDRTAISVTSGAAFTCVILDTRDVKCWGQGSRGRLGSGSQSNIGIKPTDMGDNLAVVDLGTGAAQQVMLLDAGDLHCCATLRSGVTKCWGYNNYGQLGLETTESHGDKPDSMGDNLLPINFGTAIQTSPPPTTTATTTSVVTSTLTTTTRTTTTETNTTTSTTATTSSATLTSSLTSSSTMTTTNTNTSTWTTTTTLQTSTATTTTSSTATYTAIETLVHSDVPTNVKSLGFTISGLPPSSPISILSTEPGLWANMSQVLPGDMLQSINGVSVSTLTAVEFLQLLQSRPLSLDFLRSSAKSTEPSSGGMQADQSDRSILVATVASNLSLTELGLTTSGMPPEPVRIAVAEPGLWADVNGLSAGDEVLSINGKLTTSMSPDEFMWLLRVTRPLDLLLSSSGNESAAVPPASLPGSRTLFTAVDKLAFSIGTLPPGPVCVSSVSQGLWADRSGMRPGDRVVSVNGLEVGNATPQELLPLFMTRPLLLRLRTWGDLAANCTSGNRTVPVDGGLILAPSATEELFGFGSLGFTVEVSSGVPARIAALEDGLWAQRQGFLIGDQVTTIDGRDPSGMEVIELLRRLHEVRPLSITLFRSLTPPPPPGQNRTLLADVGQFGFSFDDWTSVNRTSDGVRFLVAATQPRSWASRLGLAPGQSLLSLNGTSVSDMSPSKVFETLQLSRPLSMTFSVSVQTPSCCAAFPVDLQVATANATTAQPTFAELGFTLNGVPPARVQVWSVDPGKWASASGIRPGGTLVSVNGRNLATIQEPNASRRLADIQLSELTDMLQGTRPLSLVITQSAYWERDSQQGALSLLSSPGLMGFSIDKLPPGRISIAEVQEGGWAARNGLQAGAELLTVDGRNASILEAADFMRAIQETRPLSLAFSAPMFCAGANCSWSSVVTPTPVDGPFQLTVVANATDEQPGLQRLGFTTDGEPPGRVRLVEIEPDLWANQSGIQAGDELVSINGQNVTTLAPAEMRRLLDKVRPLSFVITRTAKGLDSVLAPPEREREAWDFFTGNNFLGFSVGAVPPQRVCVTGLEPNLWARRLGLPLGVELLRINGLNVSTMDPREFGRSLQQIRPLMLSFAAGSNCSQSTLHVPADRWPYRTQALPSDARLSFLVSGMPPQPVRVAAATPGGWADRVGVVAGDELLQIGDTHVTDMTPEELVQGLQARPLLLMFAPRFGSSAGTAGANQTVMGVPADSPVFTARAQPFDVQLGFSVTGSPPGRVRISSTDARKWAAKTGLSAGDELVSVNGKSISELTPEELAGLLQGTRPLDLKFSKADPQPEAVPGNASNCSYQTALATSADYELGLYVGPLAQGIAPVVGVERGMWAQRSGAAVGDLLCSLDGRNVSDLQQQEVLNLMQQVRPLSLTFCRCQPLPNQSKPALDPGIPVDKVPQPYVANATDADPRLGFSITQLPSGKVRVAAVIPESWSSQSGVSVGDELQLINGQPVASMSIDALEQLLGDVRPLSLGFSPFIATGAEDGASDGVVTATPVDKPDFQAVASASESNLGFQVRRLPAIGSSASQNAERVLVDSTAAGTWASRSGLHPGDELVSINGVQVGTLNPAELAQLLRRSRPLRLNFSAPAAAQPPPVEDANCTNISATATTEQSYMGFFVSSFGTPPVTVVGVQAGSWAHRIGVATGDILQFLNGLNVSTLGLEAAQQLWGSRPLTVVFSRCRAVDKPAGPPGLDPDRYTQTVSVSDMFLGFLLSGSVPGPVQVASVINGTWAARSSLAVGDILESVNGTPMSNFSNQGLLLALQQRPLSLGFRLPSKSGSGDNSTGIIAVPADQPSVTNVTASLLPIDTMLGFSVTALPPGKVLVATVNPRQWAARSGLLAGDELLAFNGRSVSNLSSQDLLRLLQESRPFTLSLGRLPVAPAALQSNLGQACNDLAANATLDAPDLGLFVAAMDPGAPAWPVTGVVRGLWADVSGIAAGDLLTAINSQNVSVLSQQDLRAMLTDRPLSVTYRRCTGTARAGIPVDKVRPPFSAAVNTTRLGLSLAASVPAGLWRVAAVQVGSWAAAAGVQVGDVLTTVGGTSTSGMAKAALWALLQSSRPLLLSFAPRISSGNGTLVAAMPVDLQDYTASAGEDDDLLSFSISGRPPNVRVASTKPGLWAERSGVGVGDLLLTVNSRRVFRMSIGELTRLLQDVRPLDLTFNASTPGVGFPLSSLDPGRLNCSSITSVATVTDAELGFFLGSVSGDGALVVGVETGLWAQLGGIVLGDQLYTVNGLSVSTMQDEDLVSLLSVTRPLSLTFRRCSGPLPDPVQPVDAQGYFANFSRSVGQLGLALNGAAPARVRVGAVVGGSWADTTGVKVGDELLQINGRNVSEMANDEVLRQLRELPDPSLFLMPRGRARDRVRSDGWAADLTVTVVDMPAAISYQSVAAVGDTQLGFSIYGLPPGKVTVGSVEPGKWAATSGVSVGDLLQLFNGRNVSTMAPHQLMRGLYQTRPFSITFTRDPSKAITPGPVGAASQDCPAFPAFAVETDVELGLFTASSQDRIGVVVGVEAGMWAESYGMALGDVITLVNRKDVSTMSQSQLMTILSETRPLFIVFAHCSPRPVGVANPAYEVTAGQSNPELGFTPIRAFDFPGIVVGDVEENSWAARFGLEAGDQLLAVNGVNATTLQPLELMRLLRARPLNLLLREGHGVSPAGALLTSSDGQCSNFTAVASDADPQLGVTLDMGGVDSAYVPYVSKADPELWAGRAGMAVDDAILKINGRDTREMQQEELGTTLQVVRPLTVLFSHCGPLPSTTSSSAGQNPGGPGGQTTSQNPGSQNPGGQTPDNPGSENPGTSDSTSLPGMPVDLNGTNTDSTTTPDAPVMSTSSSAQVATSADGWLGFGLFLDPGTGQTVVTSPVAPDTWGSKNGVRPGFALLSINGTDASGTTLENINRLLNDLNARPIALVFAPKQETTVTEGPDDGGDVSDATRYTVVAGATDKPLGFSLGLPPSPVSVLSVDANTWAQRGGLTAGDLLVDIDGVDPNSLSPESLLNLLQSRRPLTLTFVRGVGGLTTPSAQTGQWPWLVNASTTTEQEPGGEVLLSAARGGSQAAVWQLLLILAAVRL